MRYRIMCSTEWEDDYVYCEDKDTANMLFGILVDSNVFSYVLLEEEVEHYDRVKEWASEEIMSKIEEGRYDTKG